MLFPFYLIFLNCSEGCKTTEGRSSTCERMKRTSNLDSFFCKGRRITRLFTKLIDLQSLLEDVAVKSKKNSHIDEEDLLSLAELYVLFFWFACIQRAKADGLNG